MITVATAVLGLSVFASATASAPPVFPSSVEPPSALAEIRPGMTVGELRTALTAFEVDEHYTDAAQRRRLIKDAGGGVSYYVLVANDVVARIGIEAPARGLIPKLTHQWGPPTTAINGASEQIRAWSAPGWRIDLACRETRCRLAFHRTLSAAFFGAAVAPPGPLSTIRFGMSQAELAAIAPPFASGGEVPAGPEDVRLAVDAQAGRVRSILIAGLPAHAHALLSQAWGASTEIGSRPNWFNPQAGWRARYDDKLGVVQLTEYMPVMAFLGPGDQLALPLLGLTAKQLAKSYPKFQAQAGGGHLALPPTEFASALTMIGLQIDPQTGKSARATFALPFDTAEHKQNLLAVLEAKWGKARAHVTGGQTRLTFPAARTRVEVLDGPTELVVQLR